MQCGHKIKGASTTRQTSTARQVNHRWRLCQLGTPHSISRYLHRHYQNLIRGWIVKDIEIELHPNNINRDAGFCIGKSWRPLISSLKKCLYLLCGLPPAARAAGLLCTTVSASCEKFLNPEPTPLMVNIPKAYPTSKVIISVASASEL
jgi:hypothetical protein